LHNGQKGEWAFPTIGLGLDARTSKYKVARFFYRSLNFKKWAYSVGIEMFTIGGGSCWSTMEDPPFPIRPGAVTYFKGSLYLHIWSKLVEVPPQGFLRFNLEDETFSFICHPRLLQSKEERLNLIELGGELCLAQCLDEQIVVWMLRSDDGHEWVRQYVISLSEALYFHALFVLPRDIMLLRSGHCLYHYVDAYAREMVCLDRLRYKNSRVGSFDFVGQDIFFFDIFPYTESLVPVTNRR
jgi:F-box interacting protein